MFKKPVTLQQFFFSFKMCHENEIYIFYRKVVRTKYPVVTAVAVQMSNAKKLLREIDANAFFKKADVTESVMQHGEESFRQKWVQKSKSLTLLKCASHIENKKERIKPEEF